jgi:hypothetical protein
MSLRRETLERQAVSERAIRWRVVRPRTFGEVVSRALEEVLGRPRGRRERDWFRTTKMKNVKATQNQRPQTVGGLMEPF